MTDLELLDRCIAIIDSQYSSYELTGVAERVAQEIIEGLHPPPEEE